jgi:hypothetical protein
MKNSKGLRGATDAMAYCKSMQKGGPKPMIRSMKSYEMGGQSETATNADLGNDLKRGWRKVKRAVRNAVHSVGKGSHTPTYRKSKCGGPGSWC